MRCFGDSNVADGQYWIANPYQLLPDLLPPSLPFARRLSRRCGGCSLPRRPDRERTTRDANSDEPSGHSGGNVCPAHALRAGGY